MDSRPAHREEVISEQKVRIIKGRHGRRYDIPICGDWSSTNSSHKVGLILINSFV